VKTNTNSSGCITVRVKVAIEFRRSTRNSRTIMAANVRAMVGCGTGVPAISAAMAGAVPAACSPAAAGAAAAGVAVVIPGTPVR
jgi:hypothetical protein